MPFKARFKLGLWLLGFCGATHAATPQQAECALDGNQSELNACAAQRLRRADADMNRLYQTQINKSNAASRIRLRDAQRAWIVYRDKTCLYETGPREASGSIWPMQDALCRASLTQQRSALLKSYVECTEGGCPN